jgi:hypothetical protein
MAGQDVASIANTTIEGVSDIIPNLTITAETLADKFSNTRATRVSNRLFRIISKYAMAGGDSRSVSLDGGPLPLGSPAQWLAGGVTPVTTSVAFNWTELTAMIGQKVDGVAVVNAVTEGLADLAKMMKNWKDIGLHTDGTGNIGTVSSVANKTYTLSPTPFGTRNIEIGQTVDIVNPNGNVTRGSVTVANKTAYLGALQTFTYATPDVPGVAANDIVRYGGLTDGVPKWINGLRYLVNFSTTGELHGIPRSTPQVVANGFDMGGSSITRSAIQLLLAQRRARVRESEIPEDFWYTHDTQYESLKEIGYDQQYVPLNGRPGTYDPFFKKVEIEGKGISIGQHADQQAMYLLCPASFGWVKFGEPFWPTVNGTRVWNTYNQGGTANLQMVSAYIDPSQTYLDNAPAQGVITGLGAPAGYINGQ